MRPYKNKEDLLYNDTDLLYFISYLPDHLIFWCVLLVHTNAFMMRWVCRIVGEYCSCQSSCD